MLLDVIVPIYNVEKYVPKLVESINQQTLDSDKYNIIFVNDGSTDNSISMIKTNVSKHINYTILYKKNGGLSDARNYGINNSNSPYLMFIDGDDYIKNNFFETMLNDIIYKKSSISMCETIWLYDDKEVVEKIKGTESDNLFSNLEIMFDSSIAAWNKIYKRELFKNDMYTKGLLFEDLDFIFKILSEIDKISFVYKPLIYYRQNRKESIINTISDNDIKSYNSIFDKNIDKYRDTKYYVFVEQYFIRRFILSMSKKYLNTNLEKEYIINYEKRIKNFKEIKKNKEYTNNTLLVKIWVYLLLNKRYKLLKILGKML